MTLRRGIGAGALILVAALVAAPASARILKTRGLTRKAPGLSFTVGSGFEFLSSSEQREYGFPFLLESAVLRGLTLTIEPAYTVLRPQNAGSIRGFGDLETTASLEVVTPRRYRPSLAVEAGVQLPTSRHREIGTGTTDYSIGAILNQEFVRADVGLNATYRFAGSPPGESLSNTFQLSLATDWHLHRLLDIKGEFVRSQEQDGTDTELTVGLAEKLGERLKLEQGVILKTGGTPQLIVAWEREFGPGK